MIPVIMTIMVTLAGAGEQVDFHYDDGLHHTITSGNAHVLLNEFNTGLIKPYQLTTLQFEREGIYPYFCMIHPWQEGVVIVGEINFNPTMNVTEGMKALENSTKTTNSKLFRVT